MDITELILFQHDRQRRMFAVLDDLDSDDTETLAAVWEQLATFLEVHAEAEERFFYPHVLRLGSGAGGADSAKDETKDAIKDHNEIRDAVGRAAEQETGSEEWWKAVIDARLANSDHMAEEEREDLADFRRHADPQTRHEIAVAFVRFEALHARGVQARDKDPEDYVTGAAGSQTDLLGLGLLARDSASTASQADQRESAGHCLGDGAQRLLKEPDRLVHAGNRADGGYVHVAIQNNRYEAADPQRGRQSEGRPGATEQDIGRGHKCGHRLDAKEISLTDASRRRQLVSVRKA